MFTPKSAVPALRVADRGGTTYRIQREASGYSIWTAAPYTGDRRDYVTTVRTKHAAVRKLDKLYAAQLGCLR